MEIGSYLLAPRDLGSAWEDGRAAGLIDLAAWPRDAAIAVLPPFPLLGIGDPAHPVAGRLDTLIEDPVSVESALRGILQAPRAACAAMSLLRAIGGLDMAAALGLESLCYGMLQGSAEHAAWQAARRPSVAAAAGEVRLAREGATLRVILDRPWARNAIDRSMRDQLFAAFSLAVLDTSILSVRLRAAGQAFSVGADLDEFGTTRDPATAHGLRARTLPAVALAARPGLLDVHVQGACIGAGLEMAAFAARLTAGPKAWFQLPELSMGIIPGAGGCVSLPRRIGRQRTALMVLSGRRITAATALRWGLIDAIINKPPGDEGGTHPVG